MENNLLNLNPMQAALKLHATAKRKFTVAGRGVGKSTIFGDQMHEIVQQLPGASAIILAKSYTHLLTSILPSAFSHLERLGYYRDVHYVVGKQPPREWGLPYHPPVKDYQNYITFWSGTDEKGNLKRPVGFYMASQERIGSGRGPNTDFLLTDETLRINKKRMDEEIFPTIRANKDRFKHVPFHLGEFHSTSMPYSNDSRWILEQGEYYLKEFGVDYFAIWRQIVRMQLDLLDILEPEEFKRQWNEISILKRIIAPKISKDSTLFILSNALDNWMNVGISYIREQRKRLPEIVFLIEIMNMLLSMNDSAFYALNTDTHVYYDGWDDDFTNELALSTNYDFNKLADKNSEFLSKKYYNPNAPLYLFFDWGGTGSFCLACQFNANTNTLFIIKEFYAMPPGEMPRRLISEVTQFFSKHTTKHVFFVRDTYGDNTSIQKSKTINEEAITELKRANWRVTTRTHRHKEPPMFEKWQLMQKIMKESDKNLFKIRIDGNNCKYLIIAAQEVKVKQVGNELHKDKSLERKHTTDQRTAPHLTDALDKGCYYLSHESKKITFIDANL